MRIFAQDLSWPYWFIAVAAYIALGIFNLVEVRQATRDRVRRWQAIFGLWLLWGGVWYFSMGGWPLRQPPHEVVSAVLAIVAGTITGWVVSKIKES